MITVNRFAHELKERRGSGYAQEFLDVFLSGESVLLPVREFEVTIVLVPRTGSF